MIDPTKEVLITPAEATWLYPCNSQGKKVHVSKIYRDMTQGSRGIVLESIRTPRLCTTREAIARFFVRLSEGPTGEVTATKAVARVHERRIEHELDRLGI